MPMQLQILFLLSLLSVFDVGVGLDATPTISPPIIEGLPAAEFFYRRGQKGGVCSLYTVGQRVHQKAL